MSILKELRLTKMEQSSLQIILLRAQIEDERMRHLKTKMSMSKMAQELINTQLEDWKKEYGTRINKSRDKLFNIDDLDINAETGEVIITPQKLIKKVE